MKLNKIILVLLFVPFIAAGQQIEDSLKSLNQKFQTFEYEKVITEADSLLKLKDSLVTDTVLEIYRMKGISHFSLLQDRLAEDSFTEILKIDTAYTLDSATTSPKIISFYNEIKTEYKKQLEELKKLEARVDTVYITDIEDRLKIEEHIRSSVIRSIALPGWGHLYNGQTAKGIILTSLGAASLISSVYFIFDTNSKEDDYINTTNVNLIPSRWDDYNSSYKMRNFSLIVFAAVWIYSQLDLLLFSDFIDHGFPEAEIDYNADSGLNLNFRLAF